MPCPVCGHGMETIRRATGTPRRIRCQTCDGRGVVAIAEMMQRDAPIDRDNDDDIAA